MPAPLCEAAVHNPQQEEGVLYAEYPSSIPLSPLMTHSNGSQVLYEGWTVEQERELVLLSFQIMDRLGVLLATLSFIFMNKGKPGSVLISVH